MLKYHRNNKSSFIDIHRKKRRNFGKGLAKLPKAISKINTRKELSKVAAVSHDTIVKVKKIDNAISKGKHTSKRKAERI